MFFCQDTVTDIRDNPFDFCGEGMRKSEHLMAEWFRRWVNLGVKAITE